MTLEELTRLLEQQTQYGFSGQATPISYDQIIQAIQGQYQPVQFEQVSPVQFATAMPASIPISGAQRFITEPVNAPAQIFEYGRQLQQQAPYFVPNEFDIEQYRYRDPVTVSDVVDVISGGDGGDSSSNTSTSGSSVAADGSVSTGLGGFSISPSGTVTANTISPNIASVIGMVVGIPGLGLAAQINNAIANSSAAAMNSAISDTMGVNAVDGPSATAGPGGSGGAAASAAAAAAAAASAAGHSDAAIGAASQAAADATVSGADAATAAAAGAAAAAAADGAANSSADGPAGDNGGASVGAGVGDSGANSSADGPAGDNGDAGVGVGSSGDGGGGGGGGGKIICTAMNQAYGFGSYRNAIWIKYSQDRMTKAHEVGYHTLFLPLVKFAFNGKNGIANIIVRKILEHGARHRTSDLRAEMRGTKRDFLGRIYRSIFEPICYAVGKLKGY